MYRSHGAKVADIGVVRPLGIREPVDELRDHEIEVRITLTVRVRRLVDGHAVHISLEVRAVVEVVPAHQILIGFALAAVQRHDETRDGLQQLTGPVDRQELQLLVRHRSFAGGLHRLLGSHHSAR